MAVKKMSKDKVLVEFDLVNPYEEYIQSLIWLLQQQEPTVFDDAHNYNALEILRQMMPAYE